MASYRISLLCVGRLIHPFTSEGHSSGIILHARQLGKAIHGRCFGQVDIAPSIYPYAMCSVEHRPATADQLAAGREHAEPKIRQGLSTLYVCSPRHTVSEAGIPFLQRIDVTADPFLELVLATRPCADRDR